MGMEIMERMAEIYYGRLSNTRAMITNLFKMFKFQTGKSKLIETYYEHWRLRLTQSLVNTDFQEG